MILFARRQSDNIKVGVTFIGIIFVIAIFSAIFDKKGAKKKK